MIYYILSLLTITILYCLFRMQVAFMICYMLTLLTIPILGPLVCEWLP